MTADESAAQTTTANRPAPRWLTRGSASAIALLATVYLAGPFLFTASEGRGLRPRYHIDFDVYVKGGEAFLRGENLYTQDYEVGGITLPFTYPPFSALLFSPFHFLGVDVGALVLNILTIILLWAMSAILIGRLWPSTTQSYWSPGYLALATLPLWVILESVMSTLGFAQVNVFLAFLIVADLAAKRLPFPRGILVGLAAAIKLTPAVFGLYFLVKKDFKAAAISIASGVFWTGLMWLISPTNSAQYWLHTLHDPGRIGGMGYAMNQSLNGTFVRLFQGATPTEERLWQVSAVVVVILAAVAMRRAFAANRPMEAMVLNSLVALLCSPISWSHHWVWLGVALIVLAKNFSDFPTTFNKWFFAATLLVAVGGTHRFLPQSNNVEFSWNAAQTLIGNTYVLWAVFYLVVAALAPQLLRRAAPEAQSQP